MMPEIDSQQDYELISLTEENGKTIMKFKRKFDTCDADDNKIEVCQPRGGGGTPRISGCGCAARTLEPLAYTRAGAC